MHSTFATLADACEACGSFVRSLRSLLKRRPGWSESENLEISDGMLFNYRLLFAAPQCHLKCLLHRFAPEDCTIDEIWKRENTFGISRENNLVKVFLFRYSKHSMRICSTRVNFIPVMYCLAKK